jgi:Phage Mu protein F like protein
MTTTLHSLCLAMIDAESREQLESLAALADSFEEPSEEFAEKIAARGGDGDRAEALLLASRRLGVRALTDVCRPAIRRLLKRVDRRGPAAIRHAQTFLSSQECAQLARCLSMTTASADLLGRSSVLLRLERVARFGESTDFARFEEGPRPLAPSAAIDYFQGLMPKLRINRRSFTATHERKAFTLAGATSLSLLQRIKKILLKSLRTGEVGKAPDQIDRVLETAGVHPRNPQYADMLVRTNLMDAYQTGAQREFSAPEVADHFPVWRYLGIHDGRERPWHRKWFDKIFDRTVKFADVRGYGPENVCNCRCTFQGVYVDDWKALKRRGARVTPWRRA